LIPRGDAVLLVFTALTNFAIAVSGRVCVVLVMVNLLGEVVLPLIYWLLLCGGYLAAVGRTISANFPLDGCFLALQIGRLTGGKLPALHSLCDPVLLILFALGDRRVGLCWHLGGRSG
jgi:hypothetical protein